MNPRGQTRAHVEIDHILREDADPRQPDAHEDLLETPQEIHVVLADAHATSECF